mgnify:CR=1 FL=1
MTVRAKFRVNALKTILGYDNNRQEVVELSAVTAGVKDVRAVMDAANRARDLYGRQTVLFLDEIHRFTRSQQDALLPHVESGLITLIGAIQFINVLDFMMVMPLGPMFAAGLGMPLSRVPVVAASYTIAAGISGFLGAFFLDRFDRKPALLTCLVGLSVGTALGGFAPNVPMLLAARVIAGAFGGPATSLALAIVSDTVPAERRGRRAVLIKSAREPLAVGAAGRGLAARALVAGGLPARRLSR